MYGQYDKQAASPMGSLLVVVWHKVETNSKGTVLHCPLFKGDERNEVLA